jgi:hypothetical protein
MLLNRVKGSEMTVSTYVGFSVIAFMNIVWLSFTFKNGELSWPYKAKAFATLPVLQVALVVLLKRSDCGTEYTTAMVSAIGWPLRSAVSAFRWD